MIRLNKIDSIKFALDLIKPVEPSAKLKDAVKRYNEVFKKTSDDNGLVTKEDMDKYLDASEDV